MDQRIALVNAVFGGPGSLQSGDDAVVIETGRIVRLGQATDIIALGDAEVIDCQGRLVTAAPIDCHTHIVHGGHRAREFELRLAGASYAEIARAGGGILATVTATNVLSVADLVETALPRLDCLLAEGVSTVEVKSGYGLTIEGELKMLRAARALERHRPIRVRTSYLAAHALPPDFAERRGAYIDEVVIPGMHAAHAEGLVDAVDGFCETIAFQAAEIARIFEVADALGLPVKLHAEQLSNSGGAAMAARCGALSADHLEYLTGEDAREMARHGTVAVLLPGAFYTLKETKAPPVQALREAGVAMALATDCNPGSSPLTSILLAMNMGATLFGLTVAECLDAVTIHAARAMGLAHETGSLTPGMSADLTIWDAESPAELVYPMGRNLLWKRVFRGEVFS